MAKGFGLLALIAGALLAGKSSIGGDATPPDASPPDDGIIPYNPDDPGRAGVIDSYIPDVPGYTGLHDSIPMFSETLDEPGIVAETMGTGGSNLPSTFTAVPLSGTAILEPQAAPVETPRWNWYTPGGTITSRDPTEQEKEDGMGCPEIPGIWEYPGQSMQDLRYDEAGHILEDQGADAPAGKRWFCRAEWTYKG